MRIMDWIVLRCLPSSFIAILLVSIYSFIYLSLSKRLSAITESVIYVLRSINAFGWKVPNLTYFFIFILVMISDKLILYILIWIWLSLNNIILKTQTDVTSDCERDACPRFSGSIVFSFLLFCFFFLARYQQPRGWNEAAVEHIREIYITDIFVTV